MKSSVGDITTECISKRHLNHKFHFSIIHNNLEEDKPNQQLIDGFKKKSVIYIHNEIVLHLKRKKKQKIPSFVTTQLSLDNIALSEIQKPKKKRNGPIRSVVQ